MRFEPLVWWLGKLFAFNQKPFSSLTGPFPQPCFHQTAICAYVRVCFIVTQEILASVMIKNLDTGEEIPLIQAEEKLPAGINPLTLHIMRRTKEYIT